MEGGWEPSTWEFVWWNLRWVAESFEAALVDFKDVGRIVGVGLIMGRTPERQPCRPVIVGWGVFEVGGC